MNFEKGSDAAEKHSCDWMYAISWKAWVVQHRNHYIKQINSKQEKQQNKPNNKKNRKL